MKPKRVKFAFFCKCGTSCTGSVNEGGLAMVEERWRTSHQLPECKPCDSKTAAAVRRKHYRELAKQYE